MRHHRHTPWISELSGPLDLLSAVCGESAHDACPSSKRLDPEGLGSLGCLGLSHCVWWIASRGEWPELQYASGVTRLLDRMMLCQGCGVKVGIKVRCKVDVG